MTKIQKQQWVGTLFVAISVTIWLLPQSARAESVQWNANVPGNFASVCCKSVSKVHLQMTLSNPGISISYYAQAFQIDSSGTKLRQLSNGATLKAGDIVLCEFLPHGDSDISWYATGSAWGTPYGYWVGGASDPGGPACVLDNNTNGDWGKRGGGAGAPGRNARFTDESGRFTSGAPIVDEHDGSSGGVSNLYARYAVSPPGKSINTSGTWSGCVGAGGSNQICTVGTSGGTASATFTFVATQSNFYGDMTYAFLNARFRANSGGSNDGCLGMGALGGSVTVPAQTIQYNFTATPAAPGVPPTSPPSYLAVPSGQCPPGQTLQNGVCVAAQCPLGYVQQGNQCVFSACPAGYVRQGNQCVRSNQCTNPPHCSGNDLINSCTGALIRSCDWGCAGSSCNPVPTPSATLKATPSLVHSGNITTVSWTSQNITSCSVHGTNGDSWTGLSSTGKTSSPILGQTIYTLHCNGYQYAYPPSVDMSVTVNLIPTFNEQ